MANETRRPCYASVNSPSGGNTLPVLVPAGVRRRVNFEDQLPRDSLQLVGDFPSGIPHGVLVTMTPDPDLVGARSRMAFLFYCEGDARGCQEKKQAYSCL